MLCNDVVTSASYLVNKETVWWMPQRMAYACHCNVNDDTEEVSAMMNDIHDSFGMKK
jgi:hypothetical protein